MGFGFAQPLQRRMPLGAPTMTPPGGSMNPAASQGAGLGMGDIRSGLQRLGLMKPTMPGSSLPSPQVAAPALPSTPPLDDPSGAISSAVSNVASGGPSLSGASDAASAAAGATDALGSDAPGIGDFLMALFGG